MKDILVDMGPGGEHVGEPFDPVNAKAFQEIYLIFQLWLDFPAVPVLLQRRFVSELSSGLCAQCSMQAR